MSKDFKPKFSNPAFPESAQKQLWAKKIAEANKPKPPLLVYRGRGEHSVSTLEELVEKYKEDRDERSREITRLLDENKELEQKARTAEELNRRLRYELEQHARVDYWKERGEAAEKELAELRSNARRVVEQLIKGLEPLADPAQNSNRGTKGDQHGK